jgi:2,4-dienoyl-CoA reductase-like NADH-dependent reductase (Old Yellow Enzyme family)
MRPMTRSQSPGGVATEDVAAYYARRATNGVGLIITEGTGVDRPASLNDPNIPRFHGEAELAAWKRVADAVHAEGGPDRPAALARGRRAQPPASWQPPGAYDSPSGLSSPGKRFAEGMTEEEVADAIRAFGRRRRRRQGHRLRRHRTARRARLPDRPVLLGRHQRARGRLRLEGDFRPRRFAGDILRAVRKAVGPDYPVIIRISQWKQQDFTAKLAHDPKSMETWLGALVDAGADVIHCSQRRFWSRHSKGPTSTSPAGPRS